MAECGVEGGFCEGAKVECWLGNHRVRRELEPEEGLAVVSVSRGLRKVDVPREGLEVGREPWVDVTVELVNVG